MIAFKSKISTIDISARRDFWQNGLTLVELMVAIAIGLLLLAGLTTLFVNMNGTRSELDKSSRQIENGRYALQILTDELRHAGYFGQLVNAPAAPASIPDPCSTTLTDVQGSIGLPVQGYAGAASAPIGCLNAVAGYKPNTGIIVVRRANTTVTGFTAGSFNIQVSGCAGDSAPYTIDTSSASFTLHKNTSGCTPLATATVADVTPYDIRIFFVSNCSNASCSAAGADSVPTLKRIDILAAGASITPLVEGIENIQFDYGIDNSPATPDGIPDVYTNTTAHSSLTPSSIAEWQNVVTVRVNILARNSDTTVGYTDSKTYQIGPVSVSPGDAFKRHAYSELVRLTNPAGRRE